MKANMLIHVNVRDRIIGSVYARVNARVGVRFSVGGFDEVFDRVNEHTMKEVFNSVNEQLKKEDPE